MNISAVLSNPRRGIYLLLILIWSLSLFARLDQVAIVVPQGDEIIWKNRAETVIQKLSEHSFKDWSTHLNHPGIPPAVLMSLGQVLAKQWNARLALQPEDSKFCDALCGSRIPIALFSSLIVPLVFFTVLALGGPFMAVLAALTVTFDSFLLETGRIAHLDGVLAVFVFATALLYILGAKNNSNTYKILAGLCWGLAVATKPLAVLALPAFVLTNALVWFSRRRRNETVTSPVTWADVWGLTAGQALVALLYTRFWEHYSPYIYRLGIRTPIARIVYQTGNFFQQHLLIILAAILLGISLAVLTHRSYLNTRNLIAYHAYQVLSYLSCLLVAVTFFPAVCENIVRFWFWVAGLSKLQHDGGPGILPPKYGYLEFLFVKTPESVLLGTLLAIFFVIYALPKLKSLYSIEAFACLGLLITFFWAGFLSVSGKQSLRYLASVMPFIAVAASYGWISFGRLLFTRFRQAWLKVLTGTLLILTSTSPALSHPFYISYFNWLSGGIERAQQAQLSFHFAGHHRLFAALHKASHTRKEALKVLVSGELLQVVKTGYFRLYPQDKELISFSYIDPSDNLQILSAHYIFLIGMFPDQLPLMEELAKRAPLKEVLHFELLGARMAELYEVLPVQLAEPLILKLPRLPSVTGHATNSNGPRIELNAGIDQPGFAFFGASIRPAELLKINLTLQAQCESTTHQPEIKLQAAPFCSWDLTADQYCKLGQIKKECQIPMGQTAQVRLFWPGAPSLNIMEVSLETASSD